MSTFTRIIVDIDSRAAHHPALDRGVAIARATGAQLTVVDVAALDEIAGVLPSVEEELVAMLRERLAGIAASITGLQADAKLLLGTPAAALIDEVKRSETDLLIRAHARDLSAVHPTRYGPVDRELVRRCPAALLLVGPGARPPHPRIAGAIAPADGRPEIAALNHKVIDYTLLMAAIEDGDPVVVQAWTPFGEGRLRSHGVTEEISAYAQQQREETIASLVEAVGRARSRREEIAIAAPRGRAVEVLPHYVVSNGIDLMVIGVAERRGLAKLVLGNTAERVLRTLTCSILAVKPDPH